MFGGRPAVIEAYAARPQTDVAADHSDLDRLELASGCHIASSTSVRLPARACCSAIWRYKVAGL